VSVEGYGKCDLGNEIICLSPISDIEPELLRGELDGEGKSVGGYRGGAGSHSLVGGDCTPGEM